MADQLTTLRELASSFPELNMSNFGADEVSELNGWGIRVANALDSIIASMEAQEPTGWFSYDESKECWRQVSDQYRILGGVDCVPLFTRPAQPASEPSPLALEAEFNRGYKEGVRDASAKEAANG